MSKFFTHVLITVLTLTATLASAQETFPGTDLPTQIKVSDLPDDWYPVRIGEIVSTDMYGTIMSMSFYEGIGQSEASPGSRFYSQLSISWTEGQEIQLYSQKFLVTYVFTLSSLGLFGETDIPNATSHLTLKLVNVGSIVTMTAIPGYRPADLKEALTNLNIPTQVTPVQQSEKTQGLSNIKQVSIGVMIYAVDYDDIYPYVQSTPALKEVTRPYMKNDELFNSHNPNGNGRILFNMALSGVNSIDIENPYEIPMLFDPTPYPDGTYLVAFADTHAKFLSEEEWQALQPMFKKRWTRHGKPIAYKGDGG